MNRLFWGFFAFSMLISGGLILYACYPVNNPSGQNVLLTRIEESPENPFTEYWHKGEAEICSYAVEQNRYGEIRQGKQALIFVTEDFSKSSHVKLDHPEEKWREKVSVLKLNRVFRFVTGIYDYSMMQSIFTPVDYRAYPHSLKTTTTVQDWCGQTYMQLNLRGNAFEVKGFSYFESEGDDKYKIDGALMEDELWNRIRINPNSIPQGEVKVIQSTFTSRLLHEKLKPRPARLRIEQKEAMSYLILEYLHVDRTLTIGFEMDFPHKILSWAEMQNGKMLSKGELMESIKSAYWKENSSKFEYLRDSLNLH